MSLSYYYEFTAPSDTPAEKLERFLRDVERSAQSLGFKPTTVLNVPFDTPERRQFASRLGGSLTLQDERLKGGRGPRTGSTSRSRSRFRRGPIDSSAWCRPRCDR